MLKIPVLFGVSLWLMLGTSNSAAVVKRFLQGYPSPDYMPTFPWKNNDVSSSKYVNADDSIETSLYDVSSSESVDDDESKDTSLETDDTDLSDEDDDEILNRDRRALRPWWLKLHKYHAIATHQGIKARSYLLKGAVETPARNHGITRHYEKAGGKGAMINDFYRVVKRSQVSDAVIDGHYVGKIGQVGDMKVHYFLDDAEHVTLKPLLSIQKKDKRGNIIAKDIIHYMD